MIDEFDNIFTPSRMRIKISALQCTILMRRPFNRVQINPVFEHFPQRRQFAQFADFGFDQFCCELHFFFGGHATECDAQG